MCLVHFCKLFILICVYHWTMGHAISETFLEYPGDVKLGALFPIHKDGHTRENPCDKIQKEDGVQPLEAMLFSLDEINENDDILPGISLGVSVVDSCDNPLHASEKAVPLLKGFITRKINLTCGQEGRSYHIKRKRRHRTTLEENTWNCGDNIVGIIGPQTTAVTLKLANMGRVFRVPQVSYLATSPRLSDAAEFPYFFRTVPSDYHQANAIIELLNRFGWNYVSIVYSDSEYGETGFESIKKIIEKELNICLGESLTIYNNHFKDKDYEGIIQKLVMKKGESNLKPGVVVVFADRQPAGKLISAAKRLNKKDEFIWIGSDAWASRESVTEDREEFVEGAIAVQPLRRELPLFNEYFQGLIQSRSHHRKNNFANPWFDEYLEAYHQDINKNLSSSFDSLELPTSSNYQQLGYLHFVRDAVYAFANAIHNLHTQSCRNFEEDRLCPSFKQRVFVDLVGYIRNVTFLDVAKNKFRFTGKARNDGPPRYSIVSFQKNGSIYDWQNVGTFYGTENGEGKIECEDDATKFCNKFDDEKHPLFGKLKRCKRQECNISEIKVPDSDDKCCWHCKSCSVNEYKATEFECMPCPEGQWSGGPENEDGLSCVNKTETYLQYSDTYAIGTICVACAGVIMTIVATCIFAVHWNTPFIKASGRELSLILLAGIFLSFLTTFVIVTKPTPIICGVMRFLIGICYTICYATVVIKTNRVARIFAIQFNEDSNGKSLAFKSKPIQNQPRFVSPLSSTLIVIFLISIEVVINVIWLIADPPKTMHFNDPINKASRVLVCSGLNESIMAGLIYPFILILVATLYAFKTRKCRYVYFNETRFILFANTVTTIHWFVYVPLYLAFTNLAIRPVILSFSLSVSGIVQLCCLLFPKLYLVVFKPRKNTKATVMTTQRPRSQVAPDTPPNSVAVGISDGPILLARVYDKIPDANFIESLNKNLPKHHSIAAQGRKMLEDELLSPPSVGRRHPTWSHDLSVHERPRSRSMSITQSTQTNFNSKTISTPNGARHIIFSTGEENLANLEECSSLALVHHKGTGPDAGDDLNTKPNIKLSITDDEMEEYNQIISHVMEEEGNEEEEEYEQFDKGEKSEAIEVSLQTSQRKRSVSENVL